MENAEIIRQFELTIKLLELHGENPFKIRGYQGAVAALEKTAEPLASLPPDQLSQIEGIGKGIVEKIRLLGTQGMFPELHELLQKTPAGVVEMLEIPGLGPKKAHTLWKELGIKTTEGLLLACEQNRVAATKGFGEKTQENIRQALLFRLSAGNKLRCDEAETAADYLLQTLREMGLQATLTGQMARHTEIVNQIQLVVSTNQPVQTHRQLGRIEKLRADGKNSGPFAWRGHLDGVPVAVEILLVSPGTFTGQVFVHSAAAAHLRRTTESGHTLLQTALSETHTDDAQIYVKAGLPYILPEMREGASEFDWAQKHRIEEIITFQDLKGILHNHSTYSDGKHTLEEMAVYCQSMGYAYFGISDHSKSAFYANGLHEDRVRQQHAEIDALNRQLAPFKIFKGIESDILNDGSLDYANDVLQTFDFIVASIHSNLKMDEAKATQRLITAIENPYTTILGHPTGRLLLRREGYPIDHRKVIDACAANGVVIEINASPWRLDLDWRWLPYAMEKGVRISINPDAHEKAGLHDMVYGTHVARKGGLTKVLTFNALTATEMAAYFGSRKK